MKEKYEALGAMKQDPQLALALLMYGKVVEESCLWVSKYIAYIMARSCYHLPVYTKALGSIMQDFSNS